MALRTSRSGRWAFLALKVGAAAALLAGVYLVVANVALAAELRSMTRDPRVELRYENARTLRLGRVHIDRLEILERGRFRVVMEQVDLRVDVLQLLAGTPSIREAEAAVRSIEVGDHRVTGDMRARAGGARLGGGARSFQTASLVISEGEIRREGPPASTAPLLGTITARGIVFSEEEGARLTGAVHVEGRDAGAFLDVAGVPEAVLWALEGLDGQAFTLDAEIAVRPEGITLEDVYAVSNAGEAKGTLHGREGVYQGRFLVQRGRLTTGIEVEGNRVGVVLAPEDGWLSRKATPPAPP